MFGDHAYTIYRYFENKILTIKDVIVFGSQTIREDIAIIVGCFFSIALLAFIPPILTKIIFDNIIVSVDREHLWEIGLVLMSVIVSMSAFEITKRYVLLHFEATFDSQIEAAFWARILKLPVQFFKKHMAGELLSRISRLIEIRISFSGPLIILILNCPFSFFSLILLFIYSSFAVLIVIFALAVLIGLYLLFFKKRLAVEKIVAEKQDKLFGALGEIFSAITKIRVTGSESRIFSNWAVTFSSLQAHIRQSLLIGTFIRSSLEVAPLIIVGFAYLGISYAVNNLQNLTTGDFIAFNVLLAQLLYLLVDLLQVLNGLIEQIPSFSRVKIFIETTPEESLVLDEIDELKGEIEISNVSFKYSDSPNWILNKLSMKIEPGEYVAIVGPSGSGKTTLLRLLMRFELPTEGRIYFDNKDINLVDNDLLRKQMGIVLQNDQLIQGDIYSNIVGSNELTLTEAWALAEMVGIADDINEMPMKMRTMVAMEGSGFSGGQKERILIARAIASKPKILILDEATRALDNKHQKRIITQLSKMRMTRIVVAHRLSTLLEVDRIFVINNGQCVETGTYQQLMEKKDLFYHLVERQLV